MKRSIIAFVFMACICQVAYAASSDSLAVKVTITPAISVDITETALTLGSISAGGTILSSSAVTVTNNGSGVNETYSLSLSNPAGWTASQSAAGIETYVLNAAFSNLVSGVTWSNANDALSTVPVAASAVKFAGDQTGVSVPYNGVRKLWFQFKAPTATAIGTEQSINVIITAAAG